MDAKRSPVVLVVEDNEAIRENVVELREMEGFTCWMAGTADDALHRLEAEAQSPDVILLDLLMPGLNPVDFVAHVRRRAAWATARIILMTAVPEADVPEDLDVDAVVLKPFRAEALIAAVEAAAAGREVPSVPRERRVAR